MKILVTGANGQLGSEFKALSSEYVEHEFVFTDIEQLDIVDIDSINKTFKSHNPDILINCAAYTAVDKAEDEEALAAKINTLAPSFLARACQSSNCLMIHYSSDYVYNNESTDPLTELDVTTPSGAYAVTKLEGDKKVLAECARSIVIRTSWVYSSFGNNFVKTMLRLGADRDSLNIVSDQIGTPTYARDIAQTTMSMIPKIASEAFNNFGIYNYSNEGVTNWAEFAEKIFELEKISCKVYPITTADYGAKADRPLWSVLSKDKIKSIFHIKIPHWETSLSKCLQELNKLQH